MSQYYTIALLEDRKKKDRNNNMVFSVKFKEDERVCYWAVKTAPEVGARVYGTISDGEYGARFKREMTPEGEQITKHQAAKTYQAAKAASGDGQRQGMAIKAAIDLFIAGKITKEQIQATAHWVYTLDATQPPAPSANSQAQTTSGQAVAEHFDEVPLVSDDELREALGVFGEIPTGVKEK